MSGNFQDLALTTALIVDDSLTDRKLAGGLLERQAGQWSVLYAKDGYEALAQLELLGADVVITDLIMPRMNGRELVDQMREQFPLVPVILMTARGSEQIAAKALELGAASYVPKRRLAQDLHDVVMRVLISARQARFDEGLPPCLSRCTCEFTLENDVHLVWPLVAYLQHMMGQAGVATERERQHLGLALEEAITNAMIHGNLELSAELHATDRVTYERELQVRPSQTPYQDRRVHLRAECSPQQAEFTIRDEGAGFDTSVLAKPSHSADFDASRGRGLLLMRNFFDDLHFNTAGNEVTFVKRRTAP